MLETSSATKAAITTPQRAKTADVRGSADRKTRAERREQLSPEGEDPHQPDEAELHHPEEEVVMRENERVALSGEARIPFAEQVLRIQCKRVAETVPRAGDQLDFQP